MEENFRVELKEEILAEISQSDDADLGMSIGMRSMPNLGRPHDGARQTVSSGFEMMNMAKAMWDLPSSCDELADRGLTSNDSGSYLISPGQSEPFLVKCDFAHGTSDLSYDITKHPKVNYHPCHGTRRVSFEMVEIISFNEIPHSIALF